MSSPKKLTISSSVSLAPSTSAWTSAVSRSSAGAGGGPAAADQLGGDLSEPNGGLEEPCRGLGALQQVLVAPPAGELRFVGDLPPVLLGDIHHVADVVHRDEGCEFGDGVDVTELGDVVHRPARVGLDPVGDTGHLPGRERGDQQPSELGVARAVHGDEPLPGVEQLLRYRVEDDALPGDEVLVPPGHLDEVGMPDDGPEPRVVRVVEQAVLDGAVPGDRPFAAQLDEHPLPVGCGDSPETLRRQVGGVVGPSGAGGRGHPGSSSRCTGTIDNSWLATVNPACLPV